MREVIYLRVSKSKVEGMTKNLPYINRGEIPVKLVIEVKDSAFKEPTIEKTVTIEDPLAGTDVAADIEFKGSVITEEEAKKIKSMRIERMAEILRGEGYEITIAEEKK
jgi:hypothetical protein